MEYILYISRFLYRIRWWLLIGTAIITFAVYYFGKRMIGKTYNVEATLYTGAASGYNLEGGNNKVDWATTQNAMDNLMNIIKAESTLKRVSMRLYARSLIKGNPKEDNEFIKASNYNRIYEHLKNSPNGKEILSLIDKNSEDKTVANFFNYLRPTQANYLYGVFYYNLPYYSYNDLRAIRVAMWPARFRWRCMPRLEWRPARRLTAACAIRRWRMAPCPHTPERTATAPML